MNILVTGSSGFLGQNLVIFLEKRGHDVIGFDILEGQDIMNEKQFEDALNGVDVCIHLAAISDLYIAEKKQNLVQEINVFAVKSILKLCVKHEIPLFFASTVCAYGNNGVEKSDEESALNPTEIYAESKVKAEKIILSTLDRNTIMRLGTFYGPGMRESLAISRFIRAGFSNEILMIHGDGNQTRCYTHVEDICSGITHLVERGETGIFNIAASESISVNELVDIISEEINMPLNRKNIQQRDGQIFHSFIDCTKLEKLGWSPKFTIKEGIRNYLENQSGK